jgi:hypothetical protein
MLFSRNLIKRLIHAKQKFLHGQSHALRSGEIERLFSILSLDQSIENFLNTVIGEYNASLRNPYNASFKIIFDAAKNKIKDLLNKDLPLQQELFFIHKLRNSAQHDGVIPAKNDLEKAVIYSEDFLRQSYKLCFDINFEEVFLSDIILDECIREYFKKAEIAFSEGNFYWAIVFSGISFNFLRKIQAGKQTRFDVRLDLASIVRGHSKGEENYRRKIDGKIEGAINSIFQQIEYLDDKVSILSMGGNLNDYNLYKKLTPAINYFGKVTTKRNVLNTYYFGDDKFEIVKTSPEQDNPSNADCLRVMNFVYNSIIGTLSSI